MLAMFATENMEKRTDFLKRGFLFSIVNSLLVIAIGLFDEFSIGNVIDNIEVAFISGFGNTIAAMGIFPLFEHLFGMTTKFKLLEISDLNAPILKKMLIKAPGTYNHSIMVANMAEAACKEINCNYLLARVGGYYHDIGKIDEARIFYREQGQPGSHSADVSAGVFAQNHRSCQPGS